MWTQWIARLGRQMPQPSRRPEPSAMPRFEVCPPALAAATHESLPIGFRAWWVSAWPRTEALPRDSAGLQRPPRWPARRALPMDVARADFSAALDGLASDAPVTAAARVQARIRSARSLRELWHLRAEVYTVVARERGEYEAQRRLQPLDRHFPTRRHRATTRGPGG